MRIGEFIYDLLLGDNLLSEDDLNIDFNHDHIAGPLQKPTTTVKISIAIIIITGHFLKFIFTISLITSTYSYIYEKSIFSMLILVLGIACTTSGTLPL